MPARSRSERSPNLQAAPVEEPSKLRASDLPGPRNHRPAGSPRLARAPATLDKVTSPNAIATGTKPAIVRLAAILDTLAPAAIAVSGGIDSLTLATAAHRLSQASMHHAVSPAVPPDATSRTRELAARYGWRLDIFDAGEFSDPRYRQNPVNRCFFCKTSLYGAIAARTTLPILSGTNLDDLREYRPGLDAADRHGVRHPFVEAGLRKADIRALAAELGLGALADLPASPCLASRVETGLRIEAPVLALVHHVENLVRDRLAPRIVRCRIRHAGMSVELDAETLDRLSGETAASLSAEITAAGGASPVSFALYRTGSAFLRTPE